LILTKLFGSLEQKVFWRTEVTDKSETKLINGKNVGFNEFFGTVDKKW